eukprot:CAMPEP_0114311934 /NCGR_PEP_ID=MMETSP0059-20121206/20122_1 /TAXON_ID=36894 /ORGANISM="Pyramimonas parkeae, Strain CCMP726" /LENGTH=323 /DNA_ID=CAMNT_0001436207 /DNA_START=229 /DNA_END=1200 /DNA_ORIENTATION=-
MAHGQRLALEMLLSGNSLNANSHFTSDVGGYARELHDAHGHPAANVQQSQHPDMESLMLKIMAGATLSEGSNAHLQYPSQLDPGLAPPQFQFALSQLRDQLLQAQFTGFQQHHQFLDGHPWNPSLGGTVPCVAHHFLPQNNAEIKHENVVNDSSKSSLSGRGPQPIHSKLDTLGNGYDSQEHLLRFTSTATTSREQLSHVGSSIQDGEAKETSAGNRNSSKLSDKRCRVVGCSETNLRKLPLYCIRHRVCGMHVKMSSVLIEGQQQRFCQKCTRFHLLADYDGGKHTCRKGLEQQRQRRLQKLGRIGKQDLCNDPYATASDAS